MEKTLLALSSDGVSSYKVVFRLEKGKCMVECTCPASAVGRFCRHKLGLLAGDDKVLWSPKQKPELEELQLWIRDSRVPKLIAQLKEAEKDLERMKKKLAELKREIEKETN